MLTTAKAIVSIGSQLSLFSSQLGWIMVSHVPIPQTSDCFVSSSTANINACLSCHHQITAHGKLDPRTLSGSLVQFAIVSIAINEAEVEVDCP